MQTDGRHKNSLLGKYSVLVFTLYSQYIIRESQCFIVSIRSHRVFHVSTGFFTKLIPHVLPLLLPTSSSSAPWPLLQQSSILLWKCQEKPDSKRRFTLLSHERTNIATKGHIPDLVKQKLQKNKIFFLNIETLKELCPWSCYVLVSTMR